MKIPGLGSIQKLEDKPNNKCRKWRLRVAGGIDPKTGKYRQREKRFTGTIKEAKLALAAFAEQAEKEVHTDGRAKLSFYELVTEWIDEREKLKLVMPRTITKYRDHLSSFSCQVKDIRAGKLEPYMITDAMAKLMAGETKSGNPIGGTYMRSMLTTFSCAYKWGIEKGHVSYNPFAEVPRPQNDTKERVSLTPEQIEGIVSCMTPDDHHHAGPMFALYEGLGRSESISIQWIHVDFINDVLIVPGTKNEHRYAAMPLHPDLSAWLLRWKEVQRDLLDLKDLEQTENTYVMANAFGEVLGPDPLDKWWRSHRDSFGVPGATFYDLRHAFATTLARNQVHPKAIQTLMRHKDERMAVKVYTHVNGEAARDALMMLKW